MAQINCTVTKSGWYRVYFEYSYVQDKTTAQTTVTHALMLEQLTDGYDFDTVSAATIEYYVTGTRFYQTARININDKGNAGYTITLASGTSVIQHDTSTGEGSFTVSVDESLNVNGYGPGTITLSETVTLPTVPRASEPTLSAESVRMGEDRIITTNRASSAFTHTLRYTFGGTTAVISTGVGDSYRWTVPDLASLCNNATSGTAVITCITYNGEAQIGTRTKTVTLTVSAASIPTVSPSPVTMGEDLTVKINRRSANFTHTLTYSFNGASGTIGTDITASASWTVPLSLAKQIISAPEGVGTITCVTYNGTAEVGSESIEFAASVPNDETTKPIIHSMTLAPTGSLPSVFSGLYIQGKTGVTATFAASSEYSAIETYRMSVGDKSYKGNPATSGILASAADVTVRGTVTDARGYSRIKEETITVHPYALPTVAPYAGEKSVICARCTSDGTVVETGMYLKIKASRSYSRIMSETEQKNFCTLGYRYMTEGGEYSDDVILLSESASTDTVDVILPGIVESLTTYYMVQVFVKDTMGESDTHTFIISAVGCVAHFSEGGKRIGLGRYARESDENGIDVAWSMYFDDDAKIVVKNGRQIVGAYADYVEEQGESGIWLYRKWSSGIVECWGKKQYDAVDITTAWSEGGSQLYRSGSAVGGEVYPVTFIEEPVLQLSFSGSGGTASFGIITGEAPSVTQTGFYYLICGSASAGVAAIFHYYAVSKWK